MKITQLMLGKGFGGAERYFVDLSRALLDNGHDLQVICHRRFREIDRLRAITGLRVESFPVLGNWDFWSGARMAAAVRRFAPDVVQAHLARGALYAGRFCSKQGMPLLVKTHNYVNLKYYRHVDHFIATTRNQQEYLQQQGVPQTAISVVPNFSSIPPVAGVQAGNNETLQIASFGRFVKKKGFHVLLDAFRALLDQGCAAHLTLGGDGPEQSALLQQCRALNLDPHVTFSGWVSDVAAFLSPADLFVLPSLDEPFGIAILEAMALGKPVIATTTQGPVEILDEHSARLVAPADTAMLTKAMLEMAGDDQARMQKATAALALFKEHYSETVVVQRLTALYQSLAG